MGGGSGQIGGCGVTSAPDRGSELQNRKETVWGSRGRYYLLLVTI